ncbi:eCIS core domain-containing protein [Brevibacillus dissolubilis]|uniref:eCIS core domain-containing protein n=1 Tax=Brevibacillus dissolubilis TaxID=1844116 RepID=UPI00111769E8|nr:DUF4157 domain-containing protein [Brevibacillus dissolubilis]
MTKHDVESSSQASAASGLTQRALASSPEQMTPQMVMQMQKTIGNKATAQLMKSQPPSSLPPTAANKMPLYVQSKMEGVFGHNFADVNIHRHSGRAGELGALAYTQGNDIHFAPGQYNPDSPAGQSLLGHELAHVIQQRQGRVKPTLEHKGLPINDNPALEQEADQMGAKAASISEPPESPIQQKRASTASPQAVTTTPVIQRMLGYKVTPNTETESTKQLGTSLEEKGDIVKWIPVTKGDMIKLKKKKGETIYWVSNVGDDGITLTKYNAEDEGTPKIEIPPNEVRNGYCFDNKAIVNAAHENFRPNLSSVGETRVLDFEMNKWEKQLKTEQKPAPSSEEQNQKRSDLKTRFDQLRNSAWEENYKRSLTVVTGNAEQSHAINNLTIFHLTINQNNKAETHITINTDILKMYLNSRQYNMKDFKDNLRFLQAVNYQAYREAGSSTANLLKINGSDHWDQFHDHYITKEGGLDKVYGWVNQDYSAGANDEIAKEFKTRLNADHLMPLGYSNSSNIHFRIKPERYDQLATGAKKSAKYQVDASFKFEQAVNEIREGLNQAVPGLGTTIVTASLAQLATQLTDPKVPSEDYNDYYMVTGDLGFYREIAEMVKALGANSQMLP